MKELQLFYRNDPNTTIHVAEMRGATSSSCLNKMILFAMSVTERGYASGMVLLISRIFFIVPEKLSHQRPAGRTLNNI